MAVFPPPSRIQTHAHTHTHTTHTTYIYLTLTCIEACPKVHPLRRVRRQGHETAGRQGGDGEIEPSDEGPVVGKTRADGGADYEDDPGY